MDKARVLLLGSFHMANPGRDMGNVEVDDVLAPRRQSELEVVCDQLARFEPTRVMVEAQPEYAAALADAYEAYCDGSKALADLGRLARSEHAQVGFRVAARCDVPVIDTIDVPDVFYDPDRIDPFLEANPDLKPHMEAMWEGSKSQAEQQTARLASASIGEMLREYNRPDARRRPLQPYFQHLLPIARAGDYPGPDMIGYWYRRNFRIASNLIAPLSAGDRALVVYGAGHVPVLEHILENVPSVDLIDPLDYLS